MYLILAIYLGIGIIFGLFMAHDAVKSEATTSEVNFIFVVGGLFWILFLVPAIIQTINDYRKKEKEE